VLETVGEVYCFFFIKFMFLYMEGQHSIKEMGDLRHAFEKDVKASFKSIIKEVGGMSREEITSQIKGLSIRNSKEQN